MGKGADVHRRGSVAAPNLLFTSEIAEVGRVDGHGFTWSESLS